MSQTTVGGVAYSVGRLDGFKQLHVARRVMPVFSAGGAREYFEMLAAMSDADVEYVVKTCLGVVQREVPGAGGWAPVMANGQMMYQDIDATTLMELASAVIKENLSGFFTAVRAYAATGSTATTEPAGGTA